MRVFAIGMVCLAVAGCDSPNFRTSQFRFGDTDTLAATGSLRFVTERLRPLPDGTARPVICTEPSPDYATAFQQRVNVSANVAVPGQPSGSGSAEVDTKEQIQIGTGRTAGVIALRDGLYAACQAFANGVIGYDAYSMILSQYGNLLVAITNEPMASVHPRVSTASHNAFAAVLVACISGYDPTRFGGGTFQNSLLTQRYCRDVLQRAKRRV